MSRPSTSAPQKHWQIALICALVYVAANFFFNTTSPFLGGYFWDPDDYARLVQVLNWLHHPGGLLAGWHDFTQPRLDPGTGFVLDWSRLPDLPLAFFIAILEPLYGTFGAALLTAFLVPILMLVVFLCVWTAMARPLVPRSRLWLVPFLALFFIPAIREFLPMRVDHHGWQILLAGIGFTCLMRGVLFRNARWIMGAAAAHAVGVAIGAESLLWAIAALGGMGLLAAWYGAAYNRAYARLAATFALTLTLALLVLLPVTRSWSEIAVIQFFRLSLAQIIFASLATMALLLFWALGPRIDRRHERVAFLGFLVAVAGALFFYAVPLAQDGIYGEMSADNRRLILDRVIEAQPLLQRMHALRPNLASLAAYTPFLTFNVLWPALALVIVIRRCLHARGRCRLLWFGFAWFVAISAGMAFLWQARVDTFAHLFALPVIAWTLQAGWRRLERRFAGRKLFARQLWLLLCFGPLPVVLLPAMTDGRPLMPGTLLYLADMPRRPCDLRPVADFLNDPKGPAAKPLNILTTMGNGPELVFRTRHNVFAAPYNVRDNRLLDDFLKAVDPAEARRLAKRHDANMVLLCVSMIHTHWRMDEAAQAELDAGMLRTKDKPIPPALHAKRQLLGKLLFAEALPDWLERVRLPFKSNYVLYTIKP